MNRLQKKCIIAIVGTHLLLLTILIVGPAFFNQQPKTDSTQVLDVIPSDLIDAAFNSGVKNATPQPPQPMVQPQPPAPQPQPQVATPPKPQPVPAPSILDRVKNIFESKPVKPTSPKPEVHKIEPNLKPVVRNDQQSVANPHDARVINSAIKTLQKNLSKNTEINLSGNSSVAYANYGNAVTSIYHQKWISLAPAGMEKDNAVVTFKVTISRDGSVISASIVSPSGDANVDKAVQKMLDGVTFIAAFPDGTTDKERTYTIDFNATKISE